MEVEVHIKMDNQTNFYVLREKAVPEVLLKVVEMKKLLDFNKDMPILDAADKVGISRSSFYKYKDDISPFYQGEKGRIITMIIQVDDAPGVLSNILQKIAVYKLNVLTIHQSIPVHKVATITISAEVLSTEEKVAEIIDELQIYEAVRDLTLVGSEKSVTLE